ncbi:MAG: hypothetical protein IT221_04135 [Fluviicola sp.]|nr:hypothetical protein [Fluviicola sp.]
MEEKVKEAIELLSNAKSVKRLSGAKRLLKLSNVEAGPSLLKALENEMKDSRTWSCQYQMILALGHSKFQKGLPYLLELAKKDYDATILFSGLGDSIFRLSILTDTVDNSLKLIYQYNNYMLTNGAFRALAMLRIIPEDNVVKEIISKGIDPNATEAIQGYPNDQRGLRLWVAAASAGWKDELKESFLNDCKRINDSQLSLAIENSLKGKYIKWSPY